MRAGRRLLLCTLNLILLAGALQLCASQAPDCSTVSAKNGASEGEWIVDSEVLEGVGGDLQLLFSCVPTSGSILFDMPDVTFFGKVEITRDVTIGRAGEGKVELRCGDKQPLFDVRGAGVKFFNAKIVSCQLDSTQAPVHVREEANAVFTDVDCIGNENFSGPTCISSNFGTVRIVRGFFKDNRGNNGGTVRVLGFSKLTISNSKFIKNVATSEGGAIHATGSKVTISSSTFTTNWAKKEGGAIKAMGDDNTMELSITNTEFAENSSGTKEDPSSGGTVSLVGPNLTADMTKGVTFKRNGATDAGGCILAKSVDRLLINEGLFLENGGANAGAAMSLLDTKELVLKNLLVKSNSGRGAAVVVEAEASTKAKIFVEKGQFETNTASELLGGAVSLIGTMEGSFLNTTFSKNSGREGPALHLSKAVTMNITSCSFSSNQATGNGGALFVEQAGEGTSKIRLFDVQFTDNQAGTFPPSNGGAMYTKGKSLSVNFLGKIFFMRNKAAAGGGASVLSGATVNMEDATFSDNQAVNGTGGAMRVKDHNRLEIFNTKFGKNSALEGGALNVEVGSLSEGKVRMKRVKFLNNVALQDTGGAIRFKGNLDTVVETSDFENNSAKWGGAVDMTEVNELSLIDCDFKGNKAKERGGALHALAQKTESTSRLNVAKTTFTNNQAGGEGSKGTAMGGAVYLSGRKLLSEFADRVKFVENEASTAAGAIRGFSGELTLDDASFLSNKAPNGGACVMDGMQIEMSSVKFDENSARSKGGALVLNGGRLASEGGFAVCEISGDSSFQKNTAKAENVTTRAGAIFVSAGAKLVANGVGFLENEASIGGAVLAEGRIELELKSVEFMENKAEESGAISIAGQKAVCKIDGKSKFRKNSASRRGGAIGVRGGPALSIFKSEFSLNNAEGSGGAIDLKGGGKLTIKDASIDKNSASYGGGVAVSEVNNDAVVEMVIQRSNFTENSAPLGVKNRGPRGDGGAIYLSGAVKGSQQNVKYFKNNATRGGAVASRSIMEMEMKYNTFEKNYALLQGGGMMFARDGSIGAKQAPDETKVFVTASKFIGNSAGGGANDTSKFLLNGQGGGIFVNSALVKCSVANSTFTGNKAGVGGAINWNSGKLLQLGNGVFTKNSATTGGALRGMISEALGDETVFEVSSIDFSDNSAVQAGAVLIEREKGEFDTLASVNTDEKPNANLFRVNFSRNRGLRNCGAISGKHALLRCVHCGFTNNTAGSDGESIVRGTRGGGMCIRESAWASIDFVQFSGNSAGAGGGVSVQDSVLVATGASFKNNRAIDGGAIAHEYNGLSVTKDGVLARYRNSTVEDNSAEFGGGMFFNFKQSLGASCKELSEGKSINTLDEDALLQISKTCQNGGDIVNRHAVIENTHISNNLAQSGSALYSSDPRGVRICCKGMCKKEKSDGGLVIPPVHPCNGTNGGVFWSRQPDDQTPVFATGVTSVSFSPSKIDSHPSGRELVPIEIELLDAFGKRVTRANMTLTVRVVSPAKSGAGVLSGSAVTGVLVTEGLTTANGIFLAGPPDDYTLRFTFTSETSEIVTADFDVTVGECGPGSITDGKTCRECPPNSFAFDNSGDCVPCPENALCYGSVVLPKDGYWHATSRSGDVTPCLYKGACSFEQDGELREALLRRVELQAVENNTIATWGDLPLCQKGHDGVRCGSCQSGYGKLGSQECKECKARYWSMIIILVMNVSLWTLAGLVIRKSLDWASTVSSELQDPSGAEICQTRAAEIAKILINYLQVTGVAWTVNQNWSSSMLKVLAFFDSASATGEGAAFESAECAYGPDDPNRSLMANAGPFFAPIVGWFGFMIFWLVVAKVKGMRSGEFINRAIITMMALLFVYFIGTARRFVKLFYCVDHDQLPNEDGVLSSEDTNRWAEDTSFICFEGNHINLVAIGAPIGVLICVVFPVWILVHLFNNRRRLHEQDFVKRYGLLYKGYKQRAEFWEVVTMVRKALIAVVVVSAEPLGSSLQGTLAVGVLVLALVIHVYINPFRQSLVRLNGLEFGSLSISTFVFLSGLVFNSPQTSDGFRIVMSMVMILLVIGFGLWLVFEILIASAEAVTLWAEDGGFVDPTVKPGKNLSEVFGLIRLRLGDDEPPRARRHPAALRQVVTESRRGLQSPVSSEASSSQSSGSSTEGSSTERDVAISTQVD
ncbi:hypothetical protein BSKO_13908 [Bryopsis sp. KO-2023]|nr:hypothetical protein BSKO_13908 [Bryopsis sp. KO-2023]